MSASGFVLQYGLILAILNTMKTNKRIQDISLKSRAEILTTEVALLSILTIQYLVVCLNHFEIRNVLDFFNMHVGIREN